MFSGEVRNSEKDLDKDFEKDNHRLEGGWKSLWKFVLKIRADKLKAIKAYFSVSSCSVKSLTVKKLKLRIADQWQNWEIPHLSNTKWHFFSEFKNNFYSNTCIIDFAPLWVVDHLCDVNCWRFSMPSTQTEARRMMGLL